MHPTESSAELPPAASAEPGVAEPLGSGFALAAPNSPPAFPRVSWPLVIGAPLLVAFWAYLYASFFVGLGAEAWGPLNRGRWIVEHRQLPRHDSLTPFTDPEAPALNVGWLGQGLFFLVYQGGARLNDGSLVNRLEGGAELLRGLHLFFVLAFCLLALLAYARRTGSLGLACLGLFLLGVVAPPLVGELRTGLLGLLCFLGLLAVLTSPRLSWPSIVGVPLLLAFWANLDVSFVVGLLLLAAFAAGRAAELLGGPDWRLLFRDRKVLSLFGVLAASAALITLANPHGPKLWALLFGWATNPNLNALPFWQSMDFSSWKFLHITFLGSLVLLTLATAVSGRSFTATETVLLVYFCLLALYKQGAAAWWFVLVPWLLLPQLARLGERWPALAMGGTPHLRKTMVAAVLLAPLLLIPARLLFRGQFASLNASLDHRVPWPVAAQLEASPGSFGPWLPALARRLRASYPQGQFVGTIFADEGASDFFLFALEGRHPVFAHGEPTHFSRDHWDDHVSLRSGNAGWWELLDRFGVNLVVIDPALDGKLAEAIKEDPTWEVLPGEAGQPGRAGQAMPLLVAVRKTPLPGSPPPGRANGRPSAAP